METIFGGIDLKMSVLRILISSFLLVSCSRDWDNPLENNQAPVAVAKTLNSNVELPNSTTLDGEDSRDSDGSISSYIWSQKSGPADGSILENPSSVSTKVKFDKEGDYTFKLTVVDNLGGENSDEVNVEVKASLVELIWVEGGEFTMGSLDTCEECDLVRETPQREVTIDDFYIGKFEVTQKEWEAYMGSKPSDNSNCDNCPVENVSWSTMQEFLDKMNAQMGETGDFEYRFPTEAEWEYAALGGKNNESFKYPGSNDINEVAWYADNSSGTTHEVGGKKPNALGIYDMGGNVWEWCYDWFLPEYYEQKINVNPLGPDNTTDNRKVARGGAFINASGEMRVKNRSYADKDKSTPYIGFRVVWGYKIMD